MWDMKVWPYFIFINESNYKSNITLMYMSIIIKKNNIKMYIMLEDLMKHTNFSDTLSYIHKNII